MMLTPAVSKYLQHKAENKHEGVKDRLGRIILPLDQVAVADSLDEGEGVFVWGTVREIGFGRVWCEIHYRFKRFGFRDNWFDPRLIIKMPVNNPGLLTEFQIYMTSLNQSCLRGRVGHKNGKEIRL